MKKTFLLFLIAATLVGCSKPTEDNFADKFITYSEFKDSVFVDSGKVLPIDILSPYQIIVSDSYIVFKTMDKDNLVKVYSRDDCSKVGEFLSVGRAGNEISNETIPILQYEKSSGGNIRMFVNSPPLYMAWLDIDSSLVNQATVLTDKYDFNAAKKSSVMYNGLYYAGYSYDLGDNKILLPAYPNVAEAELNHNQYLITYDFDSHTTLNEKWIFDFEDSPSPQLFSSQSVISRDNTIYAMGYLYMNCIKIYNTQTYELTMVSQEGLEVDLLDILGVGTSTKFYRGSASGEDCFYLLKVASGDLFDRGINTIVETFTWQGEPVAAYCFKESFTKFDVDEKSNKLYVVIDDKENTGSDVIVEYEL